MCTSVCVCVCVCVYVCVCISLRESTPHKAYTYVPRARARIHYTTPHVQAHTCICTYACTCTCTYACTCTYTPPCTCTPTRTHICLLLALNLSSLHTHTQPGPAAWWWCFYYYYCTCTTQQSNAVTQPFDLKSGKTTR